MCIAPNIKKNTRLQRQVNLVLVSSVKFLSGETFVCKLFLHICMTFFEFANTINLLQNQLLICSFSLFYYCKNVTGNIGKSKSYLNATAGKKA